MSQALHHAPHPERAIASAHRILKKGGRLVILDLLSHRFERARELCADQWLGFSEVQLHQWLEEADFGKLEVTVVSREKEDGQNAWLIISGIFRSLSLSKPALQSRT